MKITIYKSCGTRRYYKLIIQSYAVIWVAGGKGQIKKSGTIFLLWYNFILRYYYITINTYCLMGHLNPVHREILTAISIFNVLSTSVYYQFQKGIIAKLRSRWKSHRGVRFHGSTCVITIVILPLSHINWLWPPQLPLFIFTLFVRWRAGKQRSNSRNSVWSRYFFEQFSPTKKLLL